MKIAGKIAILVAGLCGLSAAVCIGLSSACAGRAPGKFGRTLEFRVSALNTEHFDQFNRAPQGLDVFSNTDAREIAESGKAPAGFKWMPVSNFYLMETGGGIDPRGILSVINGRKCLLVADRPDMMLAHAANARAWGVKSVEMTATYIYGPVVKRVQIKFDDGAREMLLRFTTKYVRHSVAVVVGGQVIANFGLLTPIRRGELGLTYPEGGEAIAEQLRDELMK